MFLVTQGRTLADFQSVVNQLLWFMFVGFLEKNRDTFSPDLLGLIQTSSNKFLVHLFKNDINMVRSCGFFFYILYIILFWITSLGALPHKLNAVSIFGVIHLEAFRDKQGYILIVLIYFQSG